MSTRTAALHGGRDRPALGDRRRRAVHAAARLLDARAAPNTATPARRLFEAYQLHKSIGLTVLVLTLVRLAWRLTHPPAATCRQHMPAWERFAARATHWALLRPDASRLPLTGWLYVSAGWSIHDDESLAVPTRWFGLFEVPHLFDLPHASNDVRADTAEAALTAHAYLGFTAIGLAALHVAAALKHHFFDRDETLAHMVPGVRAPNETEAPPRNVARSGFPWRRARRHRSGADRVCSTQCPTSPQRRARGLALRSLRRGGRTAAPGTTLAPR